MSEIYVDDAGFWILLSFTAGGLTVGGIVAFLLEATGGVCFP